MLTETLLKKEIYAINIEEKTLFYAPLTRSFVMYEGVFDVSDADQKWFEKAVSIDNVPNFVRERGFVYDKDKIRLRLNITTDCNLKCGYCSVSAGHNLKSMPEDVALNAVSGFCKFAQENAAKTLEIVFSGGEPTLCMPLIAKSIARGRKLLKKNIKFQTRLLTNGLFKRSEYLKIINDIEEVQVSWDGFFGENERYGSNKRLAKTVWDNICFFVENGTTISVLVVVSETNFSRIREVVDQLYKCGIKYIFLSLKENLGRASQEDLRLDFGELGDIYFELWKYYRSFGIDINLTGTDIHSLSPFPCSVPIPNYSISPEGEISACTISFNDNSPKRDIFRIGNISNGNVLVDPIAIERVREFSVLNIPRCTTCFAKWHCRGGCIYTKNGAWFSSLPPERCEMIRNIVARKLLFTIRE